MSPIRMARLESGVRAVIDFNEAFNRHDVAGMMQLMTEDCVFENTSPAKIRRSVCQVMLIQKFL
jgi:ketosteroid isomerase-like protein